MVKDFEIEDIEELSKEEAKQVLINTIDSRYDDESDGISGYTLDFGKIGDEEVFIDMVEFVSGELTGGDLIEQIIEEEGLRGEYGLYTNIYVYFVKESSINTLVNKMIEKIKAM